MVQRAIKDNIPTPYYPSQRDVERNEQDICISIIRFWKWVENNNFGLIRNHNDSSEVNHLDIAIDQKLNEWIIKEFFNGDTNGLDLEQIDTIKKILNVSLNTSKILLNSN